MKKVFLVFGIIMLSLTINAQTALFSEDFEGVTTSGSNPATGDVPSGWEVYDEDGNTVASGVSFMNKAWKVVAYSQENGNAALSTSWYSPTGKSDDWMVTPKIILPDTTGIMLLFDVQAVDGNYPGKYQILVSTTGNTPADFTDPAILSKTSPAALTTQGASLDAYKNDTIYIAFRNVANDKYLLAIDNINVRVLPSNDAKAISLTSEKYFLVNSNKGLSLSVKNTGAKTIDSMTVEWTDGTNTHTYKYKGLNIGPYSFKDIVLYTPMNYATATNHDIVATITKVNGTADANTSNNQATETAYTVSKSILKNIVFEEGTGTWCGWCPRGIVAMAYMYNHPNLYPQFIGIAVHNGDPMVVAAYNAGAGFSAFPGANVDRQILGGKVLKQAWISYYNERKYMLSPASMDLEISYDSSIRKLTAKVSSDFYTEMNNADLRYGLVIVEDSVTGTGSSWEQTNYYSGGGSGIMGGFETEAQHVDSMVYDRVGRALVGGYNGVAGSIPSTLTDGGSFSHTFTYTLPAKINYEHTAIVALLIDNSTGVIVNATEVDNYNWPNSLEVEKNTMNDFKLYPNPAGDHVNIQFDAVVKGDVTMKIYTMGGKVLQMEGFNGVKQGEKITINTSQLSSGQYIISFSNSTNTFAKNLIIK